MLNQFVQIFISPNVIFNHSSDSLIPTMVWTCDKDPAQMIRNVDCNKANLHL
jgi:hypothetical protein